ncbi:MAG: ion transporter [Ruminococcus sp.]|nr:ion transporter [Ruminococcus sp.]
MEHIKKRTFQIISIGQRGDFASKAFDIFIALTIFANIGAMLLETFEGFREYTSVLKAVEWVTVAIFTLEYILRIWTADILYRKLSPLKARLRFLVSFDGVIDLLTILPFVYLSGFIVFRILRVARIFHLFRINTGSDSFAVIVSVIIEKKNQIFSSIFIIIVLMIASSLGIYGAEHEAQPEAFNNAFSGMWWSISALLTVGYGDIYPITAVGRIMGMVIALLGVGVVAIPTGIISAGFVERYTREQNKEKRFIDIKEMGEVLVDDKSGLAGMLISDIERDHGARIYMLLRDEEMIIARAELKVKNGDILILHSDKLKKW